MISAARALPTPFPALPDPICSDRRPGPRQYELGHTAKRKGRCGLRLADLSIISLYFRSPFFFSSLRFISGWAI